jgi:prepilin-type N-terminal cleavage/methylation domain-containing protein
MKRIHNGFTLIELLVVVSIIAIVSSIALVNYNHAQTRAKISRAKAEMQTIATGLELYYVDYNSYPRWREVSRLTPPAGQYAPPVSWRLICLTTPISYLSTVPAPDPFRPWTDIMGLGDGRVYDTYDYIDDQSSFDTNSPDIGRSIYGRMWRLASAGPDRVQTYGRSDYTGTPPDITFTSLGFYDPSNGITSNGDIVRLGPPSPHYSEWQVPIEPQ